MQRDHQLLGNAREQFDERSPQSTCALLPPQVCPGTDAELREPKFGQVPLLRDFPAA